MALVIDPHLTFEDHVRMNEIEREYFPKEYWNTPELAWELYCKNNDTYICVRDTDIGKIAAHLIMIPVSDNTFASILSGDIIDSTINAEQILKFDVPGEYKLHFLAAAIAMEYSEQNIMPILYRGLNNKLTNLTKSGVIITGISADCLSREAEILCEKLANMKFLKLSNRNSKIYWADSWPFFKSIRLR